MNLKFLFNPINTVTNWYKNLSYHYEKQDSKWKDILNLIIIFITLGGILSFNYLKRDKDNEKKIVPSTQKQNDLNQENQEEDIHESNENIKLFINENKEGFKVDIETLKLFEEIVNQCKSLVEKNKESEYWQDEDENIKKYNEELTSPNIENNKFQLDWNENYHYEENLNRVIDYYELRYVGSYHEITKLKSAILQIEWIQKMLNLRLDEDNISKTRINEEIQEFLDDIEFKKDHIIRPIKCLPGEKERLNIQKSRQDKNSKINKTSKANILRGQNEECDDQKEQYVPSDNDSNRIEETNSKTIPRLLSPITTTIPIERIQQRIQIKDIKREFIKENKYRNLENANNQKREKKSIGIEYENRIRKEYLIKRYMRRIKELKDQISKNPQHYHVSTSNKGIEQLRGKIDAFYSKLQEIKNNEDNDMDLILLMDNLHEIEQLRDLYLSFESSKELPNREFTIDNTINDTWKDIFLDLLKDVGKNDYEWFVSSIKGYKKSLDNTIKLLKDIEDYHKNNDKWLEIKNKENYTYEWYDDQENKSKEMECTENEKNGSREEENLFVSILRSMQINNRKILNKYLKSKSKKSTLYIDQYLDLLRRFNRILGYRNALCQSWKDHHDKTIREYRQLVDNLIFNIHEVDKIRYKLRIYYDFEIQNNIWLNRLRSNKTKLVFNVSDSISIYKKKELRKRYLVRFDSKYCLLVQFQCVYFIHHLISTLNQMITYDNKNGKSDELINLYFDSEGLLNKSGFNSSQKEQNEINQKLRQMIKSKSRVLLSIRHDSNESIATLHYYDVNYLGNKEDSTEAYKDLDLLKVQIDWLCDMVNTIIPKDSLIVCQNRNVSELNNLMFFIKSIYWRERDYVDHVSMFLQPEDSEGYRLWFMERADKELSNEQRLSMYRSNIEKIDRLLSNIELNYSQYLSQYELTQYEHQWSVKIFKEYDKMILELRKKFDGYELDPQRLASKRVDDYRDKIKILFEGIGKILDYREKHFFQRWNIYSIEFPRNISEKTRYYDHKNIKLYDENFNNLLSRFTTNVRERFDKDVKDYNELWVPSKSKLKDDMLSYTFMVDQFNQDIDDIFEFRNKYVAYSSISWPIIQYASMVDDATHGIDRIDKYRNDFRSEYDERKTEYNKSNMVDDLDFD